MSERVNPIHGFDIEDGVVRPVRPLPLYKLRADRAVYDAQRPPCQALPFLLSTPGTCFCVEKDGIILQIIANQVVEMQKSGVYVWAKRSQPRPEHLLWWKNEWTRGAMFELGFAEKATFYKPDFRQPMSQASVELMNCPWLSWRRERSQIWVPKGDRDEY